MSNNSNTKDVVKKRKTTRKVDSESDTKQKKPARRRSKELNETIKSQDKTLERNERKTRRNPFTNVIFVWLAALIILFLTAGGGVTVYLLDRIWNLEIQQEYTSLYRDFNGFYEKNAYEYLDNDAIRDSQEIIDPKLIGFETRTKELMNKPTVEALSSGRFKNEIKPSLELMISYIEGYQNLLVNARCVTKESTKFTDTYSSMIKATSDESKPEEERLNSAKNFLPEIAGIYQSTGECISNPVLQEDFFSFADYYENLKNADNVQDLTVETFREEKKEEVVRIEDTFKQDSERLQIQAQEFFVSYKETRDEYQL